MELVTEDILERLGRLIDKTNNFLASTNLPLPPALHVKGLTGGLKDIREELTTIYFDMGGEDVWG